MTRHTVRENRGVRSMTSAPVLLRTCFAIALLVAVSVPASAADVITPWNDFLLTLNATVQPPAAAVRRTDRRTSIRWPPCLVAVFALLGVPALAQTTAITGSVVDELGAAISGATVTLIGQFERRTTATDANGGYRFDSLATGTYQLEVRLRGFSHWSQTVLITEGATLSPITMKMAQLTDIVVVTASRTEAPWIDALATMSVVTGETIAASPAQNYGDLLRSLPGVNVIQVSARDINVTARQATSTLAASQLILLDGRTVYLDFFGFMLWDLLPNNLADIKQIEVVRGPTSAVWGANALTGVVNIITKSPREATGTTVRLSGGLFSRNKGSTVGESPGTLFSANATVATAPNDRWSYRVSAGYFNSGPFPRPIGQIPVVADPRISSATVGGAFYPTDGEGPVGAAFHNNGTSQPKFDVRIDQDLGSGGRLSYTGGVAGTEGIIHTSVGPHDIQPGSALGYGRMSYTKGTLRASAFVNLLKAKSRNLLLLDPLTGEALQLDFSSQTYDLDIGHARPVGIRHLLSYGGNIRRNVFDITIAPLGKDRNELGTYLQDEIFVEPFRVVIGGRIDKFGNLDRVAFSPRVTATYKPHVDHAIRGSYNKAFRSPSVINNFLDESIAVPADLSPLAPLLPAPLQPLVAAPFPLVVRAVGSDLPIGRNPPIGLTKESLTAYEVSYTGVLGARTTLGVSFYINDADDSVSFSPLAPHLDPYTADNPPPGWQLPPEILTGLAQVGVFLPRTAFTYLNLGPIRQRGVELSIDHRFNHSLSAFANYSWQGKPALLDDPNPYPPAALALPPTNRANAGAIFDGSRYLGSVSLNYSDRAFWSDVLNAPFHGWTDAYTMVNVSAGRKWHGGKLTTTVKCTNLLNARIQQHVFGDLITRQAIADVVLRY